MCFVLIKDNIVLFQESIPNQEFLVSIHFCWVAFQEFKLKIEHMNLTALSLKVGN